MKKLFLFLVGFLIFLSSYVNGDEIDSRNQLTEKVIQVNSKHDCLFHCLTAPNCGSVEWKNNVCIFKLKSDESKTRVKRKGGRGGGGRGSSGARSSSSSGHSSGGSRSHGYSYHGSGGGYHGNDDDDIFEWVLFILMCVFVIVKCCCNGDKSETTTFEPSEEFPSPPLNADSVPLSKNNDANIPPPPYSDTNKSNDERLSNLQKNVNLHHPIVFVSDETAKNKKNEEVIKLL